MEEKGKIDTKITEMDEQARINQMMEAITKGVSKIVAIEDGAKIENAINCSFVGVGFSEVGFMVPGDILTNPTKLQGYIKQSKVTAHETPPSATADGEYYSSPLSQLSA